MFSFGKFLRKVFSILVFIASVLIIVLAKVSPSVHWIFGLLGFLVPAVLIYNGGLVLFYLLFKKKGILLPLIVLVVGISHFTATFGSIDFLKSEKTSDPDSLKLSVLSHNLGSFSFNSRKNQSKYSSLIDLKKYDVICFQEFLKSDRDSTIQRFLKNAGLQNYYYHFIGTKMVPQDLGLLTLSKYPIVFSGEIPFQKNSYNRVSFVDIKAGEDTVRVYNIHLKSYDLRSSYSSRYSLYRIKRAIIERSWRIDPVLKSIEDSKKPVILAGDFNSHPYGYVYRRFAEELSDTFTAKLHLPASTFVHFPIRIDYIFTNDMFSTTSFKIKYNCIVSDHFPVTSIVSLNKKHELR